MFIKVENLVVKKFPIFILKIKTLLIKPDKHKYKYWENLRKKYLK